MEKIKAFFSKAGAAIKANAPGVLRDYPFTSGALLAIGFLAGAWIF